MAFIKNCENKVGKWTVTTKEHRSLGGTFEIGSRVKIIGFDSLRGYSIEDKHGNKITEIGWVI